MKKRKTGTHFLILLFAIGGIFITACSKDDAIELDESGNPIDPIPISTSIVSGNPALNDFLITKLDERIMTVNPETGQEEVVYTFEDLLDPEGIPDYENGTIFWTTDDNSINAVGLESKNFLWDTPMLEYKFSSLDVSSVACIDGVCYATGTFGVVVAVDQNTGAVKWYYSTDSDGELDNVLADAGAPIIHQNKVYVLSEEGFISDLPAYIHVLDKQTGQLLDKRELPFDVSGTPLISNNILYVPAGNLYALNADTLEVLWVFEADGVGSPFVSNDRLVVAGIPAGQSIYSALYCLDANNGSTFWEKDTGFDTLWSPIIVEEVVFGNYEKATSFAFATNGRPFAVRLSDGEELWYRDDVSVDHSPVYANGRLFFHGHDIGRTDDTDQNVGLMGMDANTGEVLWLNPEFGSGYISAPLVVAQNGVFGPSYYRGN